MLNISHPQRRIHSSKLKKKNQKKKKKYNQALPSGWPLIPFLPLLLPREDFGSRSFEYSHYHYLLLIFWISFVANSLECQVDFLALDLMAMVLVMLTRNQCYNLNYYYPHDQKIPSSFFDFFACLIYQHSLRRSFSCGVSLIPLIWWPSLWFQLSDYLLNIVSLTPLEYLACLCSALGSGNLSVINKNYDNNSMARLL